MRVTVRILSDITLDGERFAPDDVLDARLDGGPRALGAAGVRHHQRRPV